MNSSKRNNNKSKGLSAVGNTTKAAGWALDFDYGPALSSLEREWLREFIEEYYLSSSSRGLQSKEQLRDSWRAYKANRYDLMTRSIRLGTAAFTSEPEALGNENTMIARIDARRAREAVTSRLRPRPIGKRTKG